MDRLIALTTKKQNRHWVSITPSSQHTTHTNAHTHAQLALGPSDFIDIAQRLKAAFGPEKIMFGLEGGYDPELITAAIKATLAPFLPAAGGDGAAGAATASM